MIQLGNTQNFCWFWINFKVMWTIVIFKKKFVKVYWWNFFKIPHNFSIYFRKISKKMLFDPLITRSLDHSITNPLLSHTLLLCYTLTVTLTHNYSINHLLKSFNHSANHSLNHLVEVKFWKNVEITCGDCNIE